MLQFICMFSVKKLIAVLECLNVARNQEKGKIRVHFLKLHTSFAALASALQPHWVKDL